MPPSNYDAKFLAKLLEIFKGEARDHISEMSAKLEDIEHAERVVLPNLWLP